MNVISTQQLAALLRVKDTSVDAQVRRKHLTPMKVLGRRAFDYETTCKAAHLFDVPEPTPEEFEAAVVKENQT